MKTQTEKVMQDLLYFSSPIDLPKTHKKKYIKIEKL